MVTKTCKGNRLSGERCSAPPLLNGDFCFWHDPAHEAEASEARRLGGVRRKREGTLQGAYDLDTLDSVARIRRLLDIAVLDAVALENSVARARVLIAAALAAAKLLEVGELEARLEAIEAALGPRALPAPSDRRR